MRTVVVELGVNRPAYIERSLIRYPDIQFHGFEPLPEFADLLKELEKYPNYKFYPLAAWTANERKTLTISGSKGVGSSLLENKRPTNKKPHSTVEVDCIDFDAWVKTNLSPDDLNVLRADIEGSEYFVFPHMMKHGSMKYFKKVMFEAHWGRMSPWEEFLCIHEEMMIQFKQCGVEADYTNYYGIFETCQISSLLPPTT